MTADGTHSDGQSRLTNRASGGVSLAPAPRQAQAAEARP